MLPIRHWQPQPISWVGPDHAGVTSLSFAPMAPSQSSDAVASPSSVKEHNTLKRELPSGDGLQPPHKKRAVSPATEVLVQSQDLIVQGKAL